MSATLDTTKFESKPRGPGWPLICLFENLPAFEDEKALKAWNESNGSLSIMEKWLCDRCKCWHYIVKPPAPGGDSSGMQRAYSYNTPRFKNMGTVLVKSKHGSYRIPHQTRHATETRIPPKIKPQELSKLI